MNPRVIPSLALLPKTTISFLMLVKTVKQTLTKNAEVLQLPAHAGSLLADFSILKMEAIRSSETSVQSTISTRRHTPEDGILHSHRRENLKSYKQRSWTKK
jgi:hypothetical protein